MGGLQGGGEDGEREQGRLKVQRETQKLAKETDEDKEEGGA